MVQIVFGRNSEERDRFWKAHRACVEENRVRPERSLFYVKWAQDFAGFLPVMRLVDRSGVERRFSSLVRTETVDTYPKAGSDVFPAKNLLADPRRGKIRRRHINESLIQKAVKEAV